MIELDVQIRILVEGPFLSGASAMGGYGVDNPALRDLNGNLIIPKGQIKGRCKEQAAKFVEAGLISSDQFARWLGTFLSLDSNQDVSQQMDRKRDPAAWDFTDFTAESGVPVSSQQEQVLHRIKIDSETETVESGALQVIECGVAPAVECHFVGTVSITCLNEAEIPETLNALRKSFLAIPSLGAFRGVGFGKVKKFEFDVADIRNWSESTISKPAFGFNGPSTALDSKLTAVPGPQPEIASAIKNNQARFVFTIELEEPFCTGEKKTAQNIFRSTTYLSARVIKGAIAAQIRKALQLQEGDLGNSPGPHLKELCNEFSKIRICDAFPTQIPRAIRPRIAAHSLIKAKIGSDSDPIQLLDAALIEGAFLVNDQANNRWIAPEYFHDWKDHSLEKWDNSWSVPLTETRIRTAVDSEKRRARDQHLFANELVHNVDARGQKIHWVGELGLPPEMPTSQQESVVGLLSNFLDQSWLRIGKTKARARMKLLVSPETVSSIQSELDPITFSHSKQQHTGWIIVLQSPALILEGKLLEEKWNRGKDASGCLYREYFARCSKGKIKLLDRFTSESLHGGFLLHKYRPHNYSPVVLTNRGSTFVLSCDSKDKSEAGKIMEDWEARGLPIAEWAKADFGESFSTNPFLREDGFGEILVNAQKQRDMLLTEEMVMRV